MSPLPGMPGSQVSNDGDIMRMIADLQRQVKELAAQNLLATAGITAQPNGITVGGSETVNGPLTVNGASTINGAQSVNGPLTIAGSAGVSGPLNVTGTASFTGDTTIGGNANITGNVTKTNSWGGSSLGPVVFNSGSPGLAFTRAGTTYALPVGLGLSRNSANTKDELILSGPGSTDSAFLVLNSDLTFGLNADSGTGASVQCGAGGNGGLSLYGGQVNGGIALNAYGSGKVQVNGSFAVSGTKAFVMDHPVHPDTMTLMHAATESPVNGVEYWGEAVTGSDGTVMVELPSYFEALTKAGNRNIQLTAMAACDTTPWATPVIDGKFTVNAPAGIEVHWLVKAERQRVVDGYDELSFPAEQDKPLIGPQLPDATR